METNRDWTAEAGLKEEPKEKLFDHYAKYMPTLSELASGIFFVGLGLLGLTGGGIAIQTGPSSELIWIVQDYTLPTVICVFLIWIGVDTGILKGRGTRWLVRKVIAPLLGTILKATIGEDRLKAWGEKLERRFGKHDKTAQNA